MTNFLKSLYALIVDGKRFPVNSTNIRVTNDVNGNGNIYSGRDLVVSGLRGIVKIQFEGDLAKLDCGPCEITGNVNGDVDCGPLKVNGNVVAGKIDAGPITVEGDLSARKIDAGIVKARTITKNSD